MPAIKCNCGGLTNTALCDYDLRAYAKFMDGTGEEPKAIKCYAKFDENGKWVKGCATSGSEFMFDYARKLYSKAASPENNI